MNERDPELERLFRAARREEEPSDDDRRAVRRALAARIATAAAAGTAAALSTRVAAASIGKATILGWFGAGLAAGAGVGAVVVTAAVVYSPGPSKPARPATTASAPSSDPSPSAPISVAPPPEPSATGSVAGEPAAATTRLAPSAVPSLEVETRALGDVQRELRDGRPESALRLLDVQGRTFSEGSLHEERAAARVIALCAAGRVTEAWRARERFLASYPQSPSADRVRASCPP